MGAVCCTCGDLRPTVLQQAMPLHPCALLSGGRWASSVPPHTPCCPLYMPAAGVECVCGPGWSGQLPRVVRRRHPASRPGLGCPAGMLHCSATPARLCRSHAWSPRAVLWFWQASGRCGADLRCLVGRTGAAGVAGQGGAPACACPGLGVSCEGPGGAGESCG